MGDTSETSFVQLGTYSTTYMKDSTNIVWMHYVEAIRVGTSERFANYADAQYKFATKQSAIFDTGTSLSYVPYCKCSNLSPNCVSIAIAADFIGKILRGKKSTNYYGFYL